MLPSQEYNGTKYNITITEIDIEIGSNSDLDCCNKQTLS